MSVRAYILFGFGAGALGVACGRIGFEALEQSSDATGAFDAGPSGLRPGDGGAAPVANGASGNLASDAGVGAGAGSGNGGSAPSGGGSDGSGVGGSGSGASTDSGATAGVAGGLNAGSGGSSAGSGATSGGGTGAQSGAGGSGAGAPGAGASSGGSAGGGTIETCGDGTLNQDESDADCGGVCEPCDVGQACNADADCRNELCLAGICRSEGTCSDATRNQDETGVDCGGSLCPSCADGLDCVNDADCTSGSCVAGTCQGVGTCSDSAQNQDETAVDCGGLVCPPCEDGLGCEDGSDCQSGLCAAGACTSATSTCTDSADCSCDTYGGHEYWFCRTRTLADLAPSACSTVGMTLVRIDDADENDWLLQQAAAHGLHAVSDIFLIGATKVNTHPDWVWPDGEAFWTGTSAGAPLNGLYSNWMDRAPRSNFDCACMLDVGRWLDLGCGATEPFVCESP